MRKNLLLLFVVSLFSVLLIACGGSSEDGETSDDATESEGASEEAGIETDYPTGAIEIVIPYSAGGQTDISARLFAEHVREYLDTEVVVINQTGGGGAVAINEVVTAQPDGLKLLLHHDAMHVAHAIGQIDQTYQDLTPLDKGAQVNQAYVVSADAPWDSLDEFVNDAKENPGKYVYAADIGGTTHFMGGMLTEEAEIDLKMQDTGDESERMAALLGGHADIAVTSISNAVNYVDSGDYKVLAVLLDERDETAPDFPTATEQGYDIVFSVTNVLYGPKDLPEDIIAVWNEVTEKLVENEDYQNAINDVDMIHDENIDNEATANFVEESFNSMVELGEKLGY